MQKCIVFLKVSRYNKDIVLEVICVGGRVFYEEIREKFF